MYTDELFYTMKGTPGSPILLLQGISTHEEMDNKYKLIGMHCSNSTGEEGWSRGIKLNEQLFTELKIIEK